VLYDAKSKGAEAYLALAREMLAREARKAGHAAGAAAGDADHAAAKRDA